MGNLKGRISLYRARCTCSCYANQGTDEPAVGGGGATAAAGSGESGPTLLLL